MLSGQLKTKENLNNDIAKLSSYFAVLLVFFFILSDWDNILEILNALLSVIDYMHHRIDNNM